jgi:MFS family permease
VSDVGASTGPADDKAVVRGPLSAFAPLRHRNFRLLWTGLLISQTGSWMQFVALGYLVDQLTKAPIYLGLLAFAQAIPRLLFAVIGGVAADRMDRRRVLYWTNLLATGSAFLLWFLTVVGQIQVWHIIVIGAFNSLINSFDGPARQSLVPHLVEERQIMPALSLNSIANNGSGIFGPSLGGVVIAAVGVGGCFFLNAVSFLAVMIALVLMRLPDDAGEARDPFGKDIKEGFGLLARHRELIGLLGVVGVLNFFGRPYVRLMPALAREVLGVGPRGLGILQAAPAVGTILSVFFVGALADAGKGSMLLGSSIATGVLVILFGLSSSFNLSAGLLVLVGTTQAVALAAANTVAQITVKPDQRGRVMGLYSMTSFGMFALGTLPIGALAGLVGVGYALTLGGLMVVALVGLLAVTVPAVRRL